MSLSPTALNAEDGRATFAWFSAVGVACWFVIGFPFGNHNESYYWVARFQHESVWDILWTRALAATPRPLGQGLAFLGWQAGGGSSWLVQLFNFAVVVVALGMTARIVSETRTFAVTAIAVGGAFFTGYVYLFHLHGIFYSPVLALLAALLYLHEARGPSPVQRDVVAFACAIGVGLLFHPYALLLFLGYVSGVCLERWKQSSTAELRCRVLLALASVVVLVVTRPGHHALSSDNLRAFVTSYALTEITPLLTGFASILAAVMPLGMATLKPRQRWGFAGGILLCCATFAVAGLPVIVVWVAVAIAKTAYLRKWSLTGMTVGAALLPVIAPSGSPTYAIFAIFLSAIVLAWGWTAMERVLERLSRRWVVAVLLLAGLLAGAVRIGVEVPIVSRAARPLMAEREKTAQLEAVIDWMLASEYRDWSLVLERSANPADDRGDAVDRRWRPPTYQSYLDAYLASRQAVVADPSALVVTFGTHEKPGMTLVKTVPGRFAGTAMVFKSPDPHLNMRKATDRVSE